MSSVELLKKSIDTSKAIKEKQIDQQLFDKIVNLIENEEVTKAQKPIKEALKEQILDIRLICFFLYGDFLERGLSSFIETLPILQNLIEEKWELLQPEKSRDKHTQTSLYWLFTHIINKLKYCEKLLQRGTKHPIWKKCEGETTPEQYQKLAQEIKNFSVFFEKKWPESQTIERIAHLLKRVQDLKKLFSKPVVETEAEIEPLDTKKEPVLKEETPTAPTLRWEGSNALKILCEKLKTFETLIEKEEFNKAAICAQSISSEIETFNPVTYLPEIFSTFYSLYAKHANSIAKYEQEKESLQRKLLESLFKADMKSFVEW